MTGETGNERVNPADLKSKEAAHETDALHVGQKAQSQPWPLGDLRSFVIRMPVGENVVTFGLKALNLESACGICTSLLTMSAPHIAGYEIIDPETKQALAAVYPMGVLRRIGPAINDGVKRIVTPAINVSPGLLDKIRTSKGGRT